MTSIKGRALLSSFSFFFVWTKKRFNFFVTLEQRPIQMYETGGNNATEEV